MERYIIGIDSGTTGIKAVLFDEQGNEIAKRGIGLKGYFPQENQYEEDMEEIWEKAQICVKSVAAQVDRDAIIGIGITAQGDGLWMAAQRMLFLRWPGGRVCRPVGGGRNLRALI